jgi:hypothetical protein
MLKLPEETLLQIFRYLRDDPRNFRDGPQDFDAWGAFEDWISLWPPPALDSVSRTCRTFHRITKPLLQFRWRTTHFHRERSGFIALAFLLKRLLDNSSLRWNLRQLVIDEFEAIKMEQKSYYAYCTFSSDLGTWELEQLRRIQKIDPRVAQIVQTQLELEPERDIDDDAVYNQGPVSNILTGAILSMLPNLEILEITHQDYYDVTDYFAPAQSTLSKYVHIETPFLQNLRKIIANPSNDDIHYPIDWLTFFFQLPSLREIYGRKFALNDAPEEYSDQTKIFPPKSSPVHTLVLVESQLSNTIFPSPVSPKTLRKLILTGTPHPRLIYSGSQPLEEALLEFADSLEELRLEFSTQTIFTESAESFPPSVPTFVKFTKLRILHIDLLIMIGYSKPVLSPGGGTLKGMFPKRLYETKVSLLGRLPTSLQEFGIYYSHKDDELIAEIVLQMILEFLENCGTGKTYPHVREFTLCDFTWPEEFDEFKILEEKERILDACTEAGVVFRNDAPHCPSLSSYWRKQTYNLLKYV